MPLGKDLEPRAVVPPRKVPGTRDWIMPAEMTWDQRLKYPFPRPVLQTNTHERITFSDTSDAGRKKGKINKTPIVLISLQPFLLHTKRAVESTKKLAQ